MTFDTNRGRRGGATRRRVVLGATLAAVGAIAIAFWWRPATTSVPDAVGANPVTATASPSPAPSAPATASSQTATSATDDVPAPGSTRLTPVRIRVPAIGVDATLVKLGLTSDGALDVPTTAMAAGWYTGSPVPGRIGPAVIAGHVHWSGIPAVFARLAKLAPGNRIIVTRSDGTTAAFTVDRVAAYSKARFPTGLVYGRLDFPGLRLITCGGFDPAARAYEANVIVFATLV